MLLGRDANIWDAVKLLPWSSWFWFLGVFGLGSSWATSGLFSASPTAFTLFGSSRVWQRRGVTLAWLRRSRSDENFGVRKMLAAAVSWLQLPAAAAEKVAVKVGSRGTMGSWCSGRGDTGHRAAPAQLPTPPPPELRPEHTRVAGQEVVLVARQGKIQCEKSKGHLYLVLSNVFFVQCHVIFKKQNNVIVTL